MHVDIVVNRDVCYIFLKNGNTMHLLYIFNNVKQFMSMQLLILSQTSTIRTIDPTACTGTPGFNQIDVNH